MLYYPQVASGVANQSQPLRDTVCNGFWTEINVKGFEKRKKKLAVCSLSAPVTFHRDTVCFWEKSSKKKKTGVLYYYEKLILKYVMTQNQYLSYLYIVFMCPVHAKRKMMSSTGKWDCQVAITLRHSVQPRRHDALWFLYHCFSLAPIELVTLTLAIQQG